MAAPIVVNQPGVYLVDEDGNLITRADGTAIGSAEGLLIMGKDGTNARYFRVDANGDLVSLPLPAGAATAALQTSGNAILTTIDADTSTLAAVDFATQTTLASILVDTGQIEALLATIDVDTSNLDVALSTRATEATLASIKDTDGIKKITDELPAGTQDIGSFRLRDILGNGVNSILSNAIRRLEARSSITSPDGATDADVGTTATATNRLSVASRLTDGVGFLASIVDNSIRRLEARSTLVGQVNAAGAEVKVTTIADTENPSTEHRLQTESRIAPGSTINIGTGIPADPAALEIAFVTNGGSPNLLVNGSVTPVVFQFQPPVGVTLSVQQMLVVFTADDFSFDGDSFGPNALLTNGVKFEIDVGGVVTEIFNIKQNEDFLRVPGRIPLVNNTGPKDVLGVAFAFGGLLQLSQAADDKILITVRDNLTGVKLKYFTVTVYGAEV